MHENLRERRHELTGWKKVLILGVANERSIAWGITKAMKAQSGQRGADLFE